MKKYNMAVTICLVTVSLAAMSLFTTIVSADDSQSPANASPVTSTVSGDLPVYSGWTAYNFYYPGDHSDVALTLNYDPGDLISDQGVTFLIYDPQDPPPGGTPMDTAGPGSQPGQKAWQFDSEVAGNYTVFIQNWDYLQRPIHFTLSTTNIATGMPGPALTFVSSGPQPAL